MHSVHSDSYFFPSFGVPFLFLRYSVSSVFLAMSLSVARCLRCSSLCIGVLLIYSDNLFLFSCLSHLSAAVFLLCSDWFFSYFQELALSLIFVPNRVPNKSSQARLGQTWLGLIKSSQTIKRLGSFLGTGVWPMFALCMP